jgi:predicted O-methyltransferase YrrM
MPRPLAFVLILIVIAAAIGMFVLVSPAARPDVPLPAEPAADSAALRLPQGAVEVLASIKETDRGSLAVSEEDGHLLRVLAAGGRARRALEIGAASGYSAIWIGLGLRETGGHLTTIEYDPVRARNAAGNIEKAGLSDVVTVVAGDAFTEIPRLAGTFDFVFLDAWKKDYKRFLDLVLPRLDRGGLFLAHNVVNKSVEMPEFLSAIQDSADLVTAIVTPSGEGISISYKRR